MKTVLFDLDGTLLPMDQRAFIIAFLKALCRKLISLGTEEATARRCLEASLPAVLQNDGRATGREVFFAALSEVLGYDALSLEPALCEFYREEFSEVSSTCGREPLVRTVLELVKTSGARAVLATSPIFPREGVYARIGWAGLSPEDFALITTYENTRFCKPSLGYYRDLLCELSAEPGDCLMVGNDATEDMVAGELGISTFLLTDYLINRDGVDITRFERGGYPEMLAAVERFLSSSSI